MNYAHNVITGEEWRKTNSSPKEV